MTEQEEQDRKAKLRKKIEYQVACEEKAFRIVERLIDNPIEQDWFVDSLQFITPSHYQDVVEERAVSKLCGYPLCPKTLGDIPAQKYFISTRSNKVYDIEERKNFCNSRCYKASKHIEKQISTDPVWARKEKPRRVFELLPLNVQLGKLGDEVQISTVDEMRAEVKKLERFDHYQHSLEEMGKSHRDTIHRENKSGFSVYNKEEGNEAERDEKCVYTLDKALSEMKLGNSDQGTVEDIRENHDSGNKEEARVEERKSRTEEKEKNDVADEMGKEKIENGSSVENKSKSRKGPGQKQKEAHSSQQSKTEYLMRLLDKKKSLLAKMADIQTVSDVKSAQTATEQTDKSKHDETARNIGESDAGVEGRILEKAEVGEDSDNVMMQEHHINETSGRNVGPGVPSGKKSHSLIEELSETPVVEKSKELKPVSLTVLQMICKSVKSWITKETIDYLKIEENESQSTIDRTQYEKQYRALVAKVDAQEKEFSDLIGEECQGQESEDKPTAPAPHFEVLRQEAEENQLRVREFMKGSFTYKENKDTVPRGAKNQKEIVLPTVDKYDQVLIRQRIVLERINKVLPDLLSPLHLPVGEIFSEIRQLTGTFNFTRENILFKPAEWTVVTLVLLKLLSRKQAKLSTAFSSPSAVTFLTVLLTGVQTDLETLEREVKLLTKE